MPKADMEQGPDLQTRFALGITFLSGLPDQRIFRAFSAVRREAFLGPPPWYRMASAETGDMPEVEISSSDLEFVYQDDVVAIDRARGINNGAPGLHAHCLAVLGIQAGQDILHVGAGTGYYSAILAELTGADGHVAAFEIDPLLAGRARDNLASWTQVRVHAGSGISSALPACNIIYVCAGATHPCAAWLKALRPGGKLLFPLQFETGFSGLLLIEKPAAGAEPTDQSLVREKIWDARFVIRAGYIHCEDLPPSADRRQEFVAAFEGESWTGVKRIVFNDEPDETCWFHGDGWWLGR